VAGRLRAGREGLAALRSPLGQAPCKELGAWPPAGLPAGLRARSSYSSLGPGAPLRQCVHPPLPTTPTHELPQVSGSSTGVWERDIGLMPAAQYPLVLVQVRAGRKSRAVRGGGCKRAGAALTAAGQGGEGGREQG